MYFIPTLRPWNLLIFLLLASDESNFENTGGTPG
jgi:hypothetical protein